MARMKVLICGASGRMGTTTVRAVHGHDGMEVVAAVDVLNVGKDAGALAQIEPIGVPIEASLPEALRRARPDVLVDFTTPGAVMDNLRGALREATACVVGTTGLSQEDLAELRKLCEAHDTTAIVAPNFSLGANLLMQFAAIAARHFDHAEIIELHHERKKDAPSGTAMLTADRMAEARSRDLFAVPTEHLKLEGARGGERHGIQIHAVRLPGLVAHQVVLFGGPGETLTIRHDTTSHESFMPGLLLAIEKTREVKGLVYGLEGLLG
jgi:4-hydroxy-tetrahydrodipicolinate reductase